MPLFRETLLVLTPYPFGHETLLMERSLYNYLIKSIGDEKFSFIMEVSAISMLN